MTGCLASVAGGVGGTAVFMGVVALWQGRPEGFWYAVLGVPFVAVAYKLITDINRNRDEGTQLSARVSELALELPRVTTDDVPGVRRYDALRLGEVTRHFDRQLDLSLQGWAKHSLGVQVLALGVQGKSLGVTAGSIGVEGSSTLRLEGGGVSRVNLQADAFVAVFEQESAEGDIDTFRVVVPSEEACREFLQAFVATLGQYGAGTPQREALLGAAASVASSLATDISYSSDRLMAYLRRPIEKRPTVRVIGIPLDDHSAVGCSIRFGDDDKWYGLFPAAAMHAATKRVDTRARVEVEGEVPAFDNEARDAYTSAQLLRKPIARRKPTARSLSQKWCSGSR